MRLLRRLIVYSLLFMIVAFGIQPVVFAAEELPPPGGPACPPGEFCPPTGDATFCQIVERVTDFFFWIMMAVGIIVFLLAAYLFMTSQGNPQKLTQAKTAFFFAIIGVVLGFISLGIVEIFSNFFGVDVSKCGF